MTKKKTITTLICIVVIGFIAVGALKIKEYYNNRYVASDVYYTEIPSDISYDNSWLYNSEGEKVEQGYSYELIGYNAEGEERTIQFSKAGRPDDLYSPGTYLEVTTSNTIVLGQTVIEENKIPQKAIENIKKLGTEQLDTMLTR